MLSYYVVIALAVIDHNHTRSRKHDFNFIAMQRLQNTRVWLACEESAVREIMNDVYDFISFLLVRDY
jgi:hypothetical protein